MCKSIDFFFSFSQKLQGGGGIYSKSKGGPSPPSTPPPSTSEWVGRVENQQGSGVFSPNIHQNFISPNWRENRWERNSYSQCLNYHLLLLCARHAIGFFFFFFFCQYFAGRDKVQLLSFLWVLSFVLLFFFTFYLFIFWFNWT